jgi:hypothetical protein
VRRAVDDLGLAAQTFEVVLGGGVLAAADTRLRARVFAALAEDFPNARPVVPDIPAAAGAAVAALERAGASADARARLRAAFPAGYAPHVVHG